MAKLRGKGGPTLIVSRESEAEEIKRWYRWQLERTTPPKFLRYEPVKIGPTWQWTPEEGWLLPEHTIGWDLLAWAGMWLNGRSRAPWQFTMEQARFTLWYYAVDERARFLTNSAVLQRLKGWGKDPLAATYTAMSMCGPVVPYWDGDTLKAHDEAEAWVQIAAVSEKQTKNTMKLFPSLISQEAKNYFGFSVGKTTIWAMGDTRFAEAITSNPDSIEGGRPTLLIENETQNWTESNGGHAMVGAIEGNTAKAPIDPKTGLPLRPARELMICNAYVPGRDSVAQRTREAWEETQGEEAVAADFGLLYDSLEAPPEAPLTAEAAPDVVRAVRGDADWLDPDGNILNSIKNGRNAPSESRRKWYNQVVADEDSWVSPQEIDPLRDIDAVLDPADEVVVFFDGSKSDDATGIVYCRVADGHCGVVGMWQKPPRGRLSDEQWRNWIVPRGDVDAKMSEFVEFHNVVALFADPSHTRDDETLELYWDTLLDEWHARWKNRLRMFAREGKNAHAVMFDMSDSANAQKFVDMVGIVTQEITTSKETGVPQFTWDGDIRLRTHLLNAKRMPTKWGLSIGKNNRESKKKIDLAVCLVGARLVRRMYLLNRKKKRGGGMW